MAKFEHDQGAAADDATTTVTSKRRGFGGEPAGVPSPDPAVHEGGGAAAAVATGLRVRVVHCSMEQAKYPVAAGRYKGIPMEGAISFLNHRLGRALSRLQEFDLFPEEAGTARYVPAPDDSTYPRGAIVVGLGQFGQLSSTQLTRAIERGVIEYAIAQQSGTAGMQTLGVSSVLIGTPGRYGLSVQSSVFATVQGVARAAARLARFGAVIDDLEFIELYEGKAEEAALAIVQLKKANRFAGMEVPIEDESRIDVRPGARPGSGGYEESGAPWLRLQLRLDGGSDGSGRAVDASSASSASDASDAPAEASSEAVPSAPAGRPASQTLTWVSLGRSSQAERLEVHVPTDEIRRHVRSAVHDPVASVDTNLTLYEMLFPHDAKLELDERDNLHLLVDESTAWIPWELVTGRDTNGNLLQPLARRAGVLRQLIPLEAERTRRTFRPIARKALVIGDPPGDPRYWPRLPGARQEAERVAEILQNANYEVTTRIYDDTHEASAEIATEIRNAFFHEHYSVVHIAGHGTYDESSVDPFANGVVIGPDEVLSAAHVEDRLVTPDLVFLNCCHVGRIDAPDHDQGHRRSSYADLAASMSLQLMRIGVRAVVAAGWAVDDRAALVFAEHFYSQMTGGGAFGQSVGNARIEAYGDGKNNTWGAYQCYGDPDFQFYSKPRSSSDERLTVLSPAHLVKHLKTLEMKAGDADRREYCDEVAEWLGKIEEQHLAEFDGPQVREAFAAAYAAAGAFEAAVVHYREAVLAEKAQVSVRALEQLANYESRLAAMIHRKREASTKIDEDPVELCTIASTRIDQLLAINETAERQALKGSLHKRWVTIAAEPDEQVEHRRASRDAYERALQLSRNPTNGELNVYHGCLTLQMAFLAGEDGFDAQDAADRWQQFQGYRSQLSKQFDALDPKLTEGSYFDRARRIDIRASLIIFDGQLAAEAQRDEIVDGFKATFKIRSSASQRRSVIDHYLELGELLADESQQAAARYIAERLQDD